MWIFTSKGFVSMVSDFEQPGNLLVRARSRKHLQDLLPGQPVKVTPGHDYRFRVSVPQQDVAGLFANMIAGIDYNNFKDSVENDQYHDACTDVWSVMFNYQRGQR